MAIITISRGSWSGGLMLANALGDLLGYEVVGREEIVKNASEFGVPEEGLREVLLKPPNLSARLKHSRRCYLAFVRYALCQRVQKDNIIYHGNAGHLLLRGIPNLFCVCLIAPFSFRMEQVIKQHNISEQEAVNYIKKADQDRENWTRFVYGLNYLDPYLYDLVINLRTLEVEGAAELVAAAVRRPEFTVTDLGKKAIEDLLLASRVAAVLSSDQTTSSTDVRVEANNGEVVLSGRLHSDSLVKSVLEITQRVEGVKHVNRDNLDAPDYTV